MENKNSLQHAQVPNQMGIEGLEPKDQLVYAIIKMYDNENKQVYPSLKRIANLADMSIPSIRKCIQILIDKNYISKKRVGRSNWYEFSPYVKFEPFSPEFLRSDKISSLTKAYVVASQQYMFKDVEGVGKISYSNRELSEKINMPESSIRKCNKELVDNGYMTIIKNASKDSDTGILTESKVFKMAELFQGIIWAINKHEDDINEIKEENKLMKKTIDDLTRRLEAIERREIKSEYSF